MASDFSTSAASRRALIFFDQADIFLPRLIERFPAIEFSACGAHDELPGMLNRIRPEIILAFKFEGRPFPRRELLACEALRWLSLAFAGVDVLMPWDDARLTVTNAAGVAAEEMARYAFAAILGLFQGFPELHARQVKKSWQFHSHRSARDATLGLVGLGHSGRAIARMARAIGLRVFACRNSAQPSEEVDAVFPREQLHEMLGRVDVALLCAPLTPLTRDLFGAAAFAAMKPGSFFINMARGAMVEESALIEALLTGHLAGAVLDVTRTEPLPASDPLWDAPNLLITPHSSSEYDGWISDAALMFADNLDRWIHARPLQNRVHPDRGY
ncbi:MAG TPA: D-2-hydroxyacid dehydrogenase [Steroidobacteraceae bacterium]|nr:D-2-hydroxyacid dehydrogenase [Steroidobacteraceae bacterium]